MILGTSLTFSIFIFSFYFLIFNLSSRYDGIFLPDFVQPTIRANPTHMVIHVSTNDKPSQKLSAEISIKSVDFTFKLKSDDTCQISISNLTTRNNQ